MKNEESNFQCIYPSPLGPLLLTSDGHFLTRITFLKNNIENLNPSCESLQIFQETRKYLDIYFSGTEPTFIPRYKFSSESEFQRRVWEIISKIPFGKWIAYEDIAKIIAKEKGISKMSAQAVGGAVGKNPIGIIIPCHRVLGKKGNLTGYNGGIENKRALLNLEKIDEKNLQNYYTRLE